MAKQGKTTIVPREEQAEAAQVFNQALDEKLAGKPSYEELLALVSNLKAELASKPAKAPKQPREKGPGKQEKREQANDLIREQWGCFEADCMLGSFLDNLYEAGVLNRGQVVTLSAQSGLDGEPASQKQVADLIGCNTWQVYNYRRDALQRIAEALGVDWESLHEPLGLRRGNPLGTRVGRYLPKKQAEEKAAE